MADYGTLAEIRARLDITDATDTGDDARLTTALDAASRAIEHITGRRFYATTETRYYGAESAVSVKVDDLLSVTTLKTDDDSDRTYETTWAVTDYDLTPPNATLNGRPYSRIEVAPNGTRYFPYGWRNPRAVQVAGSFGYCATGSLPDEIAEACYILAMQTFKRKDALFGIQGSSGFYQTLKAAGLEDPTVMMLLRPYMRRLW